MQNHLIGSSSLFGDIFFMRERLISDILHRNNLEKINMRFNKFSKSSVKKKNIKKSKINKSKKTSDLLLPNINLIKSINNKNSETDQNTNSAKKNKFNYKRSSSLRNNNIDSLLNNHMNNNINDGSSLFMTNLNTHSDTNSKSISVLNTNVYNPYNMDTNTKINICKTDNNNNNNNCKFVFSYEEDNRDIYLQQNLDSKKRINLHKIIEIEKENELFVKKLKNVNSDLNKDKLCSSYEKSCYYGNIARKTKTNKELKLKIDQSIKLHLPPIILHQTPNNYLKSDYSHNNSNIISYTHAEY